MTVSSRANATTSTVTDRLSGDLSATSSLRLKVQGAQGIQTLEFVGVSRSEAIRRVNARGLTVLSVEASSTHQEQVDAPVSGGGKFPLLLFSQELLALLDAGLNLTEALETLLAKERHGVARRVLQQVVSALSEGRNFSDVLESLPRFFPDVYVATVRASERTGDLPQALSRYIAYEIQFDTLRKKLTSAAIYPVVLLVVGGLVTLFLLGYVVPRFSAVYESSGRDLPWLSAMLLAFGKVIDQHWKIALGTLLGAGLLTVWAVSQRTVRLWLLNQLLKLPVLAAQANAFRLARFYRAVSLLLAAGIPVSRALEMVPGLLGPDQQVRLRLAQAAVSQGQALSNALVTYQLATPVAESLIKVGERSGQMSPMLERAAKFADDEFSRWVDWLSRLLEPVLMMVIGVVIGTIVVLMYMPIFELAGSLQ